MENYHYNTFENMTNSHNWVKSWLEYVITSRKLFLMNFSFLGLKHSFPDLDLRPVQNTCHWYGSDSVALALRRLLSPFASEFCGSWNLMQTIVQRFMRELWKMWLYFAYFIVSKYVTSILSHLKHCKIINMRTGTEKSVSFLYRGKNSI